jgi:hypothetical protein
MAARGEQDVSETSSYRSESKVGSLRQSHVGPIRAKYAMMDTSSDVFSIHTPDDFHHSKYGNSHGEITRELFVSEFDFKVVDPEGHMHKVRVLPNALVDLKNAVALAINCSADSLLLKYIDEEKDEIVLTSDQVLQDAVTSAKSMGSYALKVVASINRPTPVAAAAVPVPTSVATPVPVVESPIKPSAVEEGSFFEKNKTLVLLGGVTLAGLIGLAFVLSRKK